MHCRQSSIILEGCFLAFCSIHDALSHALCCAGRLDDTKLRHYTRVPVYTLLQHPVCHACTVLRACAGKLDDIKLSSASAMAADDALALRLSAQLLAGETAAAAPPPPLSTAGTPAAAVAPPVVTTAAGRNGGGQQQRAGGLPEGMRVLTVEDFVRECELGLVRLEPAAAQKQHAQPYFQVNPSLQGTAVRVWCLCRQVKSASRGLYTWSLRPRRSMHQGTVR